jgi:hypothetical protein
VVSCLNMNRRIFILSLLCSMLLSPIGADVVEDTLGVQLRIRPVFKLTLETYMVPGETVYKETDLIKPSRNQIVEGKDLEGEINLGYLIARKSQDGGTLPLISEYQVLLRAHCNTNNYRPYHLTQTLLSPLRGIQHGETFPERAFVCRALINEELGQARGEIDLITETPVLAGENKVIFRSGDGKMEFLGNVIDILFWISDQQEDKVMVTQRSDDYQSTLIISMVEL